MFFDQYHIMNLILLVYDPKNFEGTSIPPVAASKGTSYFSRSHTYTIFVTGHGEGDKALLGDGDWPVAMATPSSANSLRSPVETTDFNPKLAYKMTSKPRGVAMVINNRHFTCGMKERIG